MQLFYILTDLYFERHKKRHLALNRYFIDHPPTVILDRSYCYPEHGAKVGYPACKPKLIALDKDHDNIRE